MLAIPLLLACLVSADDPPSPRDAVSAGLAYLQEEAVDWIRIQKCASCHHAPMMLWAASEARAHGLPVDDDAFQEVRSYTLGDPVAARLVPAESGKDKTGCLPTVYALLAARAVPPSADEPADLRTKQRLEDHLVAMQLPDGPWTHGGGRPPMLESQEILTLMTLLSLQATDDRTSPSRSLARKWLDGATTDGLQSRALRLLLAARSGDSPESLAPQIDQLLSLQRPDGGWSQAPDMPPDAFATGQALYALRVAGLPSDRPEVTRAVSFLTSTQLDDGSWPMTSRPVSPGGGPSKDLRPITFAAASWATLGLIRCMPD